MAINPKFARAFAQVRRRHHLNTVEEAGQDEQRLTIQYASAKAGGKVVERTIRPYETKALPNGRLAIYATDTLHGAGQIHSFLASRIVSVGEPHGSFKPRWPVQY